MEELGRTEERIDQLKKVWPRLPAERQEATDAAVKQLEDRINAYSQLISLRSLRDTARKSWQQAQASVQEERRTFFQQQAK